MYLTEIIKQENVGEIWACLKTQIHNQVWGLLLKYLEVLRMEKLYQ